MALSSGEAEYYALVKAASVALGMLALMADLGMRFQEKIEIRSDASAAIGIAHRVGVGKVRHIEVNQLWLQEMVSKGKIGITKVKSEENLADALTKGVSSQEMQWHLEGMGIELRRDRHKDAPSVASESASVECSAGAMGVCPHGRTQLHGVCHPWRGPREIRILQRGKHS